MPEDGPEPAASPAPASPAPASPASAGPASAGRTPARAAIILVGLCFGLNALSRGMGETFATFLLALTEDFKTDRAAVAAIYSVQMLIAGLGAPIDGYSTEERRVGSECVSKGRYRWARRPIKN